MNNLVKLGQENGVVVIPEIDSPGHTRTWTLTDEFAELASCPNYEKSEWPTFCNEPPCG